MTEEEGIVWERWARSRAMETCGEREMQIRTSSSNGQGSSTQIVILAALYTGKKPYPLLAI